MKKLTLFWSLFILISYLNVGAKSDVNKSLSEIRVDTLLPEEKFDNYVEGLYNDMDLENTGLSRPLFKKSLIGFFNIVNQEGTLKPIISIIDFDKPSTEKRLWIVDIKSKKILFHTLVAHGKNSGNNLSVNFSNIPNSNMSSLGFYVTRETYQGKHGLSLKIDGLDKNYNCKAKDRCIVIHGADYVSEEFIKCNGRLGRSQGCPAVPVAQHKEIISTIKDGSVIFIFKTSDSYQTNYLNTKVASETFLTSLKS